MNRRIFSADPRRLAIVMIALSVVCNSLVTLFAACVSIIPTQSGYLNAYGSFVGGDFLVFYSAARAVLSDGASFAYDPRHLNGLQDAIAGHQTPDLPLFYPPISLLIWIPFGFVPYLTAFYLWLAATVGSLSVVLKKLSRRWLVSVIVVASPLVLRAGVTGQTGILTAAILGAGLLMLHRRPITAGVFLGVMAFKPHLALMLPICLAAGGHWRTFVATALTAGLLAVTSVGFFGVGAWLDFMENSRSHAADVFAGAGDQWHRVPTVLVSVQHLTGNATAAWNLQIAAAVAAVAVAGTIWFRSTDGLARSLALAAAMFLVTPKALYYDMAVFSIPLAYIVTEVTCGQIKGPNLLLAATIWSLPSFGQIALYVGWQPGPLFLFTALVFAAVRCRTLQVQAKRQVLVTGVSSG